MLCCICKNFGVKRLKKHFRHKPGILFFILAILALVILAYLIAKPRGTEDYLVYGIDQYGSLDADGRSDAMMLVRIDHPMRRIYAVSIARDLFVEKENGRFTKVNTIVRGDPDEGGNALCDAVARNFGVLPNGWVRINFSSLVSLVDAIGGIPVTLSAEEARYIEATAGSYPGHPLSEGECLLTGGQALAFVRCRHLDDDLGRGQRQSRFTSAVIRTLSHLRIHTIRALYNEMKHAWRTSLTDSQQAMLLFRVLFARHYSVVRLQLPFEGTWHYGNQRNIPGILADLSENRRLLLSAYGAAE